MPKLVVSKAARNDLIAIRQYIRDELENPTAAVRVIRSLKDSMERLKEYPGIGKPLDALISVHTEYRYLVCENYCIFYLTNDCETMVIRILHQRQDCLRALF